MMQSPPTWCHHQIKLLPRPLRILSFGGHALTCSFKPNVVQGAIIGDMLEEHLQSNTIKFNVIAAASANKRSTKRKKHKPYLRLP
jgi:hypothetical protein